MSQKIDSKKLTEHKGITYRRKLWFFREREAFTGTAIGCWDEYKRKEIPYVNGKKHGTAVYYRDDGSKEREYSYENGKRHGTAVWYWEDGSKEREYSYEKGKKHGTVIRYYPNGTREGVTSYVNGKKHGTVIRYYPNGTKVEETSTKTANDMEWRLNIGKEQSVKKSPT